MSMAVTRRAGSIRLPVFLCAAFSLLAAAGPAQADTAEERHAERLKSIPTAKRTFMLPNGDTADINRRADANKGLTCGPRGDGFAFINTVCRGGEATSSADVCRGVAVLVILSHREKQLERGDEEGFLIEWKCDQSSLSGELRPYGPSGFNDGRFVLRQGSSEYGMPLPWKKVEGVTATAAASGKSSPAPAGKALTADAYLEAVMGPVNRVQKADQALTKALSTGANADSELDALKTAVTEGLAALKGLASFKGDDALRSAAIKQLEAWSALTDREYRTLAARNRYNDLPASLREIAIGEDADNVDKASSAELEKRIAQKAQERGAAFPPAVAQFKSKHMPKK